MYCYKCGKENEDETRNCAYCGAKQLIHTSSSESVKSQYNVLCVLGFAVSCISLFVDLRRVCAITGIAIGAVEIVLTAIWMNRLHEYAMGMLDDLT